MTAATVLGLAVAAVIVAGEDAITTSGRAVAVMDAGRTVYGVIAAGMFANKTFATDKPYDKALAAGMTAADNIYS